MSVDLRLDAKAFVGLGAFSETEQSLISPWNGADVRVSEETCARLGGSGCHRCPRRQTRASVIVARAGHGHGVDIADVPRLRRADRALLWTSGDRRTVGVSAASDDTLRLQDPPPTEAVLSAIGDLVGRSGLRALDLNRNCLFDGAFVVAAIVDTQRRGLLRRFASNGETSEPTVGVTEISAAVDEASKGEPGLLDAVARLCPTGAPDAGRVAHAVARLSRGGIVEGNPSAVRLVGPLAELPITSR